MSTVRILLVAPCCAFLWCYFLYLLNTRERDMTDLKMKKIKNSETGWGGSVEHTSLHEQNGLWNSRIRTGLKKAFWFLFGSALREVANCAVFRHGQPKGYEENKNGQSLQGQNMYSLLQILKAWEECRCIKRFGVSAIRREMDEFYATKVELLYRPNKKGDINRL